MTIDTKSPDQSEAQQLTESAHDLIDCSITYSRCENSIAPSVVAVVKSPNGLNLDLSSDMYGYEPYDNNTINSLQLSFLKITIKFNWFLHE